MNKPSSSPSSSITDSALSISVWRDKLARIVEERRGRALGVGLSFFLSQLLDWVSLGTEGEVEKAGEKLRRQELAFAPRVLERLRDVVFDLDRLTAEATPNHLAIPTGEEELWVFRGARAHDHRAHDAL